MGGLRLCLGYGGGYSDDMKSTLREINPCMRGDPPSDVYITSPLSDPPSDVYTTSPQSDPPSVLYITSA